MGRVALSCVARRCGGPLSRGALVGGGGAGGGGGGALLRSVLTAGQTPN